ncbi:MAG: DegT/DnrJ/EryC1/StrS family aminotransferase [Chloroflexi bacterium]|nr:DegT/DnrJ/EryC1/StrS family aminotransferase [Chloroflexota bacterium]
MSSAELDEHDIDAVMAVLASGRLALGPYMREFEEMMAAFAGVKHGVGVSSGTAALHLIVRSLDLQPGDEVLVPSFTFAASVNVLLFERLLPVFVDIEPDTFNLDPADIERKISPKTKAIMVVDVFGHPAPWDELLALAKQHNLHLIDDCCEAIGAEYKGKRIGQFGDAGAFAFYPNKQMTTGEGGIIVTDDDRIAELCRSMANQGRGQMGAWLVHERLGFNYRFNEMAAALGIAQLKRLETFMAKRAHVAGMYQAALAGVEGLRPPIVRSEVKMSWFVYVILLNEGYDRDQVMAAMQEQGVPSRGYFAPIHLQPYMKDYPSRGGDSLPITESVAQRTIALPFHNNITEGQVDQVAEALKQTL